MKLPKITEARKAVVAVLAAVGEIASAGLLHGTVAHVVQVVLAVAAAAGVYALPNTPAAPVVPAK
jgi:hypothetical protein